MASAEKIEMQTETEQSEQLDLNSSLRNIAYWESSLFSKVYLENDLKRDFSEKWDRDYEDQAFDEDGNTIKSGFYHFYNEFRNIAESLRSLNKKNISETDTITKIIVPILDALGWYENCSNNVEEPYAAETSLNVKEQDKIRTYRTDMILVDFPQEAGFINGQTNSDKRKREARQYCILPLEAKYWNRILDKEKSELKEDKKRADKDPDDTRVSTSFNEQILNYMSILHKKWGIITDGNIWRLVNNEISEDSPERCFEFKLESLLDQERLIESGVNDDSEFLENAKYFYLFFGKPSFVKDEYGKVFVDEVLRESRKYIDCIEEDLKDRFISAMNVMCEGLLNSAKELGTITKPSSSDLKLIRTVAESHLFNILFIKSCEARGVLPIKSPNYYGMSLTGLIDRISVFDPEKYTSKKDKSYIDMRLSKSLRLFKYKPDGSQLYKTLLKLTDTIHDGVKEEKFGFVIEGFKESIFSKEEWSFAKKHNLSDIEMVRVLFELGYSKANSAMQRNYQQIPYNYFTPRQLGSIYESFLEYKLDIADEPMVYLQKGKYKQWVRLTAAIERKLQGFEPSVIKGQAFFTPDNSERKSTGSYYTPDYIVEYIVSETIGPICNDRRSSDILDLNICDPAMGSGHFLIASLNFLTRKYLLALEGEVARDKIPSKEEVKRQILSQCIFGVDINSRAVKLAKMSLWLESAHWGKKLERLDDQLIATDTLISGNLWPEYPNLKEGGFDAIVGNPPYVSELRGNKEMFRVYSNHKLTSQYYESKMDIFYFFICRGLDLLKNSGRLGMIIEQYWLTRSNVKQLHKKVNDDSDILLHVNFGNNAIFEEAPGVHSSILILLKGKDGSLGREAHLQEKLGEESEIRKWLRQKDSYKELKLKYDEKTKKYGDPSIFSTGNVIPSKMIQQGVVTPQDNVTKSHIKKDPSLKLKSGIFILQKKELDALGLSKRELEYVKPFFEAKDCSQFKITSKPSAYLIYLTSKDNKDIQTGTLSLPKIVRHLDRYRDVITSSNGPYGLHRARQEEWFDKGSKIISVRKTKKPCFVWTEGEHYLNQSVFIIKTGSKFLDQLLAIILNSDMAESFFRATKTQGDQLQIDKEVLTRFPLPQELDIAKFSETNFKRMHSDVYSAVINFYKNINDKDVNKITAMIYEALGAKLKVVV